MPLAPFAPLSAKSLTTASLPADLRGDLHAQFAAFLDGLGPFSQARRLLRLSVAGLAHLRLLAWRVDGVEAVSEDYRFDIDVLCDDVHLELKSLLGRVAELALLLPDGDWRRVSGLISEAAQTGANGGFARYRLTVVPAFALLAHRHDSRVFQDQSVPQIVDTVLAAHRVQGGPFATAFAWRFELARDYPPRSYCVQYRESDHDFVQRLLAEEGIATRYEFAGGDPEGAGAQTDVVARAAGGTRDGSLPQHTLVCFDDPWSAPACDQPNVRFHRAAASEDDDTLTEWQAARRLRAGQSSLASFDYKPVAVAHAAERGPVDQGSAGGAVESLLDDYEPQTLYYATDSSALADYARRRQDAHDRAAKTHVGESTVRAFAAGHWFELHAHPRHEGRRPDEQRFLIRELSWQAYNNLPGELAGGLGGLLNTAAGFADALGADGVVRSAETSASGHSAPPYRNRLVAVRRDTPVAPEPSTSLRPTAPGVQTATVIGPAGEDIHTDALGRVRIRFHWQRDTAGMQADTTSHPAGDSAKNAQQADNAETGDRSCWVRVATPWAGHGWGQVNLPRIGQEVLVGFLEGDIDRPVVIGRHYNGRHTPPTFSGAGDLPGNRALAGIKSCELAAGQGYSQLLLDDTGGALRTQLASTTAATELNLGAITTPRRNGTAEARGDGFELRTDASGAIRTARGLLFSTDARPAAAEPQLARKEAVAALAAARQQADLLSRTARGQHAESTELGDDRRDVDGQPKARGHLAQLIADLEQWESGSNTDTAAQPGPAPSAAAPSKPQAGGQPIAAVSAPAGIAAATPQTMHRASGENHDQIAGRDNIQTTARRWLHNVGERISLFVRGQPKQPAIKLHAAQGDIAVQAQGGKLNLAAQLSVAISAINGKQQWAGQKEVLLTCAGAYIRIGGGNIEIKAPGKVVVKGAGHDWGGAGSMTVTGDLPRFSNICLSCMAKMVREASAMAPRV